MATTLASDLIVPEVWGDAVMTTVLGKSVMIGLADVDNELVGVPGDSVNFPKFDYIGDAVELTEGVAMATSKLTMSNSKATIKEAGKAVEMTDTAVLTAIGQPNDQARNQLALSISRKLDTDIRAAAEFEAAAVGEFAATAPLKTTYDGSFGWAAYTSATALFGDEYDPSELVGLVVHSAQHTALMNDPTFQSADKFGAGAVIQRGQVGVIGTVPVFISDRTTTVVDGGGAGIDQYKALLVKRGALALKYKRRAVVESDRDILARTNIITTNVHYATKRIDDRGVVVLTTKA